MIVLLVGLLGSRWVRTQLVPALSLAGARRGARADDLAVERRKVDRLGSAAHRRPVARAEPDPDRRRGLHGAAGVALAGRARSGARRVPRAAADLDRRHVGARQRAEHGRAVRRPRAPVDPAVRAVRDRTAPRALAGVGAEVPDRRLGRLGHAAVRPSADLRRDRLDRLHGDRERAVERQPGHRPADADRHRAVRRGPVLQGFGGAVSPVDAGRLRGRAHAGDGLHGGDARRSPRWACSCASSTSR